MKTHQTLGEFIIQHQKDFQHSTGEFSRLLSAIKLASKLVNRTNLIIKYYLCITCTVLAGYYP